MLNLGSTAISFRFLIIAGLLAGCSGEPTAEEYLTRAQDYLAKGEVAAGLIETRNAVKADPNDSKARFLLGTLELEQGDPASAEKEFRKALELGHSASAITAPLTMAMLRQSKYEELGKVSADGLNTQDQATVLASQALASLGDFDPIRAQALVDKALAVDPASPQALLVNARLLGVAKDMDQARANLEKLVKDEPEFGDAWDLLGDVHKTQGNSEDAIAAYGKSINYSPNIVSSLIKRAQAYVETSQFDPARADLKTLTGAGVKLPVINYLYGKMLLDEGKPLEAQLKFEATLNVHSAYQPALADLVLTHLSLGNLGQAEQYGKQLLSESDGSVRARQMLGIVRLESGRFDGAENVLEPLTTAGGLDFATARLLSTILLKQEKYDLAVDLMTDVLAIYPQDQTPTVELLAITQNPTAELVTTVSLNTAGASEQNPTASSAFLDNQQMQVVEIVALIGNEQFDQALQLAESLRGQLKDNAVVDNLIGRIHLVAGEQDQARIAFNRTVEQSPDNASAGRFLAVLDMGDKDLDSARSRLDSLINSGVISESILLLRSRIEQAAGDEAATLNWIQRVIDAYPKSSRAVVALAAHHSARSEHQKVLDLLSTLDDSQKEQLSALQLEAQSNMSLQRFAEAESAYDSLIELQPENPNWWYQRAQAHAGQSDLIATRRDLQKTLDISTDFAAAGLALANLEIVSGNLDAAEKQIASLETQIGGKPELEQLKQRLQAAKDSDPDAKTTFTIENTEELIRVAKSLWAGGKQDESIKMMQQWLVQNPDDLRARLTLADSLGALDRADEAVTEYQRILEVQPDSLLVLNNLAWYLQDSNPAQAIDYAQQASAIDPQNVAVLDTLAVIYLNNNKPQDAKSTFDKISAIGTKDPSILFHGAQIEAAVGNKDAARNILAPLMQDKQFPEAEEAAKLYSELQ